MEQAHMEVAGYDAPTSMWGAHNRGAHPPRQCLGRLQSSALSCNSCWNACLKTAELAAPHLLIDPANQAL